LITLLGPWTAQAVLETLTVEGVAKHDATAVPARTLRRFQLGVTAGCGLTIT
jgi:hypothetical protein